MRSLHLLLFLFVFVLFSCIDNSDYELDEVNLNPTMALPLISGELVVKDLLDKVESSNIKVYSDGLVYLAYEQQLKAQGVRELFQVPDNSLTPRIFPLPTGVLPKQDVDQKLITIDENVDMKINPEQLKEIALKSGKITYTASITPSSSQLDFEVVVTLEEFKLRSTNASFNQTLKKGSGTISIADYTISLGTANTFKMKMELIAKKHANPITIAPNSSVTVALSFLGMDFNYIKGFFGNQTATLPSDVVEVSAFSTSFKDATVSLAQPKIIFTTINDNGVPCTVDFKKLEARKPGSVLPVLLNPANPVAISYPTVLGTSATSVIAVANTKQLLDFAPTEFYYQADARINSGVTSGNNFLADTSKLRVKMNIEIPLYGNASNITLKDTIDIDLSDADQSQINTAALKLKLVNQMPLDGDVQFYLTNDKYQVISTLLPSDKTAVIKGSTVSATGELQTAGVYDQSIEITKEGIANIFKAKHIIIVAKMNTSKDASGKFPDVKFKSNYSLNITAGILASLKLNVKL